MQNSFNLGISLLAVCQSDLSINLNPFLIEIFYKMGNSALSTLLCESLGRYKIYLLADTVAKIVVKIAHIKHSFDIRARSVNKNINVAFCVGFVAGIRSEDVHRTQSIFICHGFYAFFISSMVKIICPHLPFSIFTTIIHYFLQNWNRVIKIS